MSQGSIPDRSTLNIHDAACLAPFYAAQAPHSAPVPWRELRMRGLKAKKREDSLKGICDSWNAVHTDAPLDFSKVEQARKSKKNAKKQAKQAVTA